MDLNFAAKDCLKNAKSKLKSARILKNEKQLEDAIFLYIIAYEESGKADYILTNQSFGVSISESKWKRLTGSGSHTDKILEYFTNRKKTLQKFSNQNFATHKKIIYLSNRIAEPYENQLSRFNNTIELLKHVNTLKKNLFYADPFHSKPGQSVLSPKELENLCYLFDFQSEISVTLSEMRLEILKIKPSKDIKKDKFKIEQLPSFKKFRTLEKKSNSLTHNKIIENAVKTIRKFQN